MGKEFIEYHSENGLIPYSASNICFCLTQYAKDYIAEKNNIFSIVDKKVRDAVLVDAINYLGMVGYIDFALYTQDLYDEEKYYDKVEAQCLLTVLVNHYASYIFNEDMVESVLTNNHMNECTEKFNANDGATVLLDFINYIAKRNDYDRIFTIEELYEKFKVQKEKRELNQLKNFLRLSGQYSQKLTSGQSIEEIFSNDLEYNLQEMEEQIYAMSYAYAKQKPNEKSQIKVINKRILEMKKR